MIGLGLPTISMGLLSLPTPPGVFAIPAVPYIGALGLSKDELIQALGLSFTVWTIALAAAIVAWLYAINAERKPLEQVAKPLSAVA